MEQIFNATKKSGFRHREDHRIAGRMLTALLLFLMLGVVSISSQSLPACGNQMPADAKLPDIMNMVPHHIHVKEAQKRDALLFTVGLGNVGAGPLELVPTVEFSPVITLTSANQLIYNGPSRSTGSPICQRSLADAFYFHPEHRHWHLRSVNRFTIYPAKDDGSGGIWKASSPLGSFKESFCLLDWVKMNGDQLQLYGITLEPSIYNCFFQGISRGWFDYYHHSTDGQFIDITGAPPGIYYFVLDANPDRLFLESNYDNNRSWVSLRLRYVKTNNAIVEPLFNSFSQVGEGLEAPSGTNR
jgi:hypothetical protein